MSDSETFGSADDLLGVEDDVIEPVVIPEWNRTVYVGSMASYERDAFEILMYRPDGDVEVRNMRARTAALCLRKPDRTPMFDNSTPEKLEENTAKLRQKNGKAIDRIAAVGLRLSGMSREAVDDAMGNSESDPSDAGASPSASN